MDFTKRPTSFSKSKSASDGNFLRSFLFESDKLKSRDLTSSNNDNIATPSNDSSINLTNLKIEISLPHDTLKVSLEGDFITNSITLDNNDIGT